MYRPQKVSPPVGGSGGEVGGCMQLPKSQQPMTHVESRATALLNAPCDVSRFGSGLCSRPVLPFLSSTLISFHGRRSTCFFFFLFKKNPTPCRGSLFKDAESSPETTLHMQLWDIAPPADRVTCHARAKGRFQWAAPVTWSPEPSVTRTVTRIRLGLMGVNFLRCGTAHHVEL